MVGVRNEGQNVDAWSEMTIYFVRDLFIPVLLVCLCHTVRLFFGHPFPLPGILGRNTIQPKPILMYALNENKNLCLSDIFVRAKSYSTMIARCLLLYCKTLLCASVSMPLISLWPPLVMAFALTLSVWRVLRVWQ